MTNTKKRKMLLDHKWWFNEDSDKLYDGERQLYMLMHNSKRLRKKISTCDYEAGIELIHHGLNMNKLVFDNTYVDEYQEPINNRVMKKIIKESKDKEIHPMTDVVNVFLRFFDEQIKMIESKSTEDLKKIQVYVRNKSIHYEQVMFIISEHNNEVEIHKLEISPEHELGYDIEKIHEFTNDDDSLAISSYIKEYNSKSTQKILDNNTIGVQSQRNIPHQKCTKLISLVAITNTWFNVTSEFNLGIIKSLYNEIKESKFEYKFN